MVVHGRPKTPKNTSFLGITQPPGVVHGTAIYSRGHNYRPGHVTCVLVWSKSDRRRLRKTLHKQTNRQTNRHYENNGHLAVNQKEQIKPTQKTDSAAACSQSQAQQAIHSRY